MQSELKEQLSHLVVDWEGTTIGYMPFFAHGNPEVILRQGQLAVTDLIDALSDPGLFVAAHVLLTQISAVEYQGFPEWNGLSIEMAADGNVTIDLGQRHELARRWTQWNQTQPRPSSLPSSINE